MMACQGKRYAAKLRGSLERARGGGRSDVDVDAGGEGDRQTPTSDQIQGTDLFSCKRLFQEGGPPGCCQVFQRTVSNKRRPSQRGSYRSTLTLQHAHGFLERQVSHVFFVVCIPSVSVMGPTM